MQINDRDIGIKIIVCKREKYNYNIILYLLKFNLLNI